MTSYGSFFPKLIRLNISELQIILDFGTAMKSTALNLFFISLL